MQNQTAENSTPKTPEALYKEIATLIAEGFLSFHPTSPMFFSIENAIVAWHQQPDTNLVDQLLENCGPQIKQLAQDSFNF